MGHRMEGEIDVIHFPQIEHSLLCYKNNGDSKITDV